MNLLNILSGGLELKKQYLMIAALTLIVAALAGLYAMNSGPATSTDTPIKPDEITVNVTVEQEKPDPDKAAKFREGEFKKSEPVSW